MSNVMNGKFQKILIVICLLLLAFGISFTPAIAFADDQPNISFSIDSDKDRYSPGDVANIQLHINHNSGNNISNVSYQVDLPDAFDSSDVELTGNIGSLKAGDERFIEINVPIKT